MLYRLTADAVLVLHLGFIVFVVLGGLLALRWRWVAWVHLPAAAWGTLVEVAGWICPLTPAEIALRRTAGGGAYETSFVERYLVPVVYPSDLTRELQIALGVLVLGINLGVYSVVWRKARRRPRSTCE